MQSNLKYRKILKKLRINSGYKYGLKDKNIRNNLIILKIKEKNNERFCRP